MKIDLTVLNSKKETVLQSSKDDLFFVAISTYWEYARGTDECKTLVKNLKTERKEYQDRYDELELSAQKSLNKVLDVIKKELKGTESEHPDIWVQVKKFEDFKRGYDDQDRRIQPLEDLAQKYRRIIGQILHDLYKIPKYTNLALKYIRADQGLPQVILDSFNDPTYHEYIQYQTTFKDGLSYRLCFEIDRITYISQAINDTPNKEIELKKKLENVSVFDDKYQTELMELQALQEWCMIRKGEKKTHEGYTFDFNVFDREKTHNTFLVLHSELINIISQKTVVALIPEKHSSKYYITKSGDDFYHDGNLIQMRKDNESYKIFSVLFEYADEGGSIPYKQVYSLMKNIKGFERLNQDTLHKKMLRALTDNTNGFVKKSKIKHTSQKPLFTLEVEGKINFNNKRS